MDHVRQCFRCESNIIMVVSGKCNDSCSLSLDHDNYDGYVPSEVNIGAGDYIVFNVCANCGQMEGT